MTQPQAPSLSHRRSLVHACHDAAPLHAQEHSMCLGTSFGMYQMTTIPAPENWIAVPVHIASLGTVVSSGAGVIDAQASVSSFMTTCAADARVGVGAPR